MQIKIVRIQVNLNELQFLGHKIIRYLKATVTIPKDHEHIFLEIKASVKVVINRLPVNPKQQLTILEQH